MTENDKKKQEVAKEIKEAKETTSKEYYNNLIKAWAGDKKGETALYKYLGAYSKDKKDKLDKIYKSHKKNNRLSLDKKGELEGINYGLLSRYKNEGEKEKVSAREIEAFSNYLDNKQHIFKESSKNLRSRYVEDFKKSYGIAEESWKKIKTLLGKDVNKVISNEDLLKEITDNLKNSDKIKNIEEIVTRVLSGTNYSNLDTNLFQKELEVIDKIDKILEDGKVSESQFDKKFEEVRKIIAEGSQLVYGTDINIFGSNLKDTISIDKTQIDKILEKTNILKERVKEKAVNGKEINKRSITNDITAIFSTYLGEDLATIAQSIVKYQISKTATTDVVGGFLKSIINKNNIRILNQDKNVKQTGTERIGKHGGLVYDSTKKIDSQSQQRITIKEKEEEIELLVNLGFSVKTYKSFYEKDIGLEKKNRNSKKITMVSGKPLIDSLSRLLGGGAQQQLTSIIGNFYLASQSGLLGEEKLTKEHGGIMSAKMVNFNRRADVVKTYKKLHNTLLRSLMPDYLAGSGYERNNLANFLIVNGKIISTYEIIYGFWKAMDDNENINLINNKFGVSMTVKGEKYFGKTESNSHSNIDSVSPIMDVMYTYAKRRLREAVRGVNNFRILEDIFMGEGDDLEIIKIFVADYKKALRQITYTAYLELGKLLK